MSRLIDLNRPLGPSRPLRSADVSTGGILAVPRTSHARTAEQRGPDGDPPGNAPGRAQSFLPRRRHHRRNAARNLLRPRREDRPEGIGERSESHHSGDDRSKSRLPSPIAWTGAIAVSMDGMVEGEVLYARLLRHQPLPRQGGVPFPVRLRHEGPLYGPRHRPGHARPTLVVHHEDSPGHRAVLGRGVPLIEHVINLDTFEESEFEMFAFPDETLQNRGRARARGRAARLKQGGT